MAYDWSEYYKVSELARRIKAIEEEAASTTSVGKYNELVDERNKLVDEYMEQRKAVQ